MAHDPVARAQRLLRGSDLSWLETPDLARSFARLVQQATGSPWVHISLQPPGAAHACETVCGERPSAAIGRWRSAEPMTVAVCYQGVPLGSISALTPDEPEERYAVCRELARQLAYHSQRLELDRLMRQRFSRDLHLVGTSAALTQLDRFLEQASRSSLPILLAGERGSEGEAIALALHLAGPGRDNRFIQVHCAALAPERLESQLAEYLRASSGGTLVLSRIEELDGRCQRLLCQALDSAELGAGPNPSAPPRLIATASRRLAEPQALGTFYRPLLDRLDILRCDLVPLRERREDVAPLFLHSLRKLAPGQSVSLSDSARACLQQYEWPGDTHELWQAAARVALTLDPGPVELKHLEMHAPQLLSGGRFPEAGAAPRDERRHAPLPPPTPVPLPAPPSAGVHHPCIERAMEYIHRHYDRKLRLAEVAHHANASVSHLAHLLRQEANMTFTQIVTALRIEHAKRLLRENPWESITAVAGAAGFSELRHFERSFKSLVGLTPRGFRQIQAERLAEESGGFLPPKGVPFPLPLSEVPQ